MKKQKVDYVLQDLPERKDCEYSFLCVACFMGCYRQNTDKKDCDRFTSWNLQGFLDKGGVSK